jgi:predicted ATPase
MLIALGASLIATQGYAASEVEQTYLRAHHLCHHLEHPQQRLPVLRGLWIYYCARPALQTAYTLSAQFLTLAQQMHDPVMLPAAHRAVGTTVFFLGGTAEAHTHFAQGIALYDPQQHHVAVLLYGEDAGVVCRSFAAWALWCQGYPDQGLARSQQAVTLARQLAHPFSLGFAWGHAAMLHAFRREMRAAQERADAAIRLTTAQGFPFWRAWGALLRGWALAQQGQAPEGLEQMTHGLMTYGATGAELVCPYFLALLAEAHGTLGEPEAGLAVLTEALTLVETTGERWSEAELYRLRGELLLQQNADNHLEAEACFQHALDIARNQRAKSFELRAATSLARLWQQQGKRQEAHDLLAPVYSWFTEGFDTLDLKDAKGLLDALA